MPPKSFIASSADTAMLNALHIFNPERLESNEDISAAIEVLEGTIDHSNIAAIAAHAMERPFALEFIVSGESIWWLCKLALLTFQQSSHKIHSRSCLSG